MTQFRDATAEDALLISRLFAASWRVAYRGLVSQHYLDRLPDEYWLPSVRAWLISGRLSALLAYEKDEAVGCVLYGRGRDEEYGEWGEIVSIYLLPDRMRQGYGTALMARAMDAMRQDGYSKFYLWAIEGNVAADRFYSKLGFHLTGEAVDYRIGGGDVRDVRYAFEDE